jgi:hypothetical protein
MWKWLQKKLSRCLVRMGYPGYNGNAASDNPGRLRVRRTWPRLSLSRSSAGLFGVELEESIFAQDCVDSPVYVGQLAFVH